MSDEKSPSWLQRLGIYLRSANGKRRCKGLLSKVVITAVFLAMTIGLGLVMQDRETASLTDLFVGSLFYLTVLFDAGWCFYLFAPVVRIRLFNAILFMGLFVWGCMLYFYSPVMEGNYVQEKIERQIEAPNRTVAAFFPSRGGFESIARSNDKQLRLHYFVFHTSVLFYVALLTFAIFGRGIINRVHKWVTPWRGLNVFWGRSDAGLLLARSIVKTTVKDQVFFMLQQKSGDGDEWRTLTRDIDDMNGMWSFTYDSNAIETDVSKDTLAQTKGRRHFFMDESGHVNVSRADRLVKVLRQWKELREKHGKFRCFLAAARAGVLRWWWRGCETPYFYVRVEPSADEMTYQQWAANVTDVVTPVLVRESVLIAKDFIARYPMLDMPGIKIDQEKAVVSGGEFKTLIIGFGSAGQDILNEMVCHGQFLGPGNKLVPFSVDVVEQDKKVIEEYCIRHPLATRHPEFSVKDDPGRFDVTFVKENIRVEDKSFDDWFRGRLEEAGRACPYNRIIVCLKGDEKSLGIASKVVEFARRHGVEIGPGVVFARVRDPARNRYLPKGSIRSIFSRADCPDYDARITLFGDLKDIYSFDRINAEVVDTMAKVLNGRYGDFGTQLSSPEERETKWRNASFFDQLSSRAAAEGQRNILLLLGLDYGTPGKADGTQDAIREKLAALKATGGPLLETLATNEHLRWNAFHLMMGYRPWNVLDRKDGQDPDARTDLPVQKRQGRIKANQLATIGKHADIVPFDKLPDVDMKLEEWKTGRKPAPSERGNYTGLKPCSSQAWDFAFCQIVGEVAEAAGLKIVQRRKATDA